jgi:hypothetical protein
VAAIPRRQPAIQVTRATSVSAVLVVAPAEPEALVETVHLAFLAAPAGQLRGLPAAMAIALATCP